MRKRDRNKEKKQRADGLLAADLILRSGGLPPGFSLAGTGEAEPKPVYTGDLSNAHNGHKSPCATGLLSNAHNGHKSPCATGPKTSEGKAISSQNARTHGLTSKKLLLPGENEEEFAELREGWLVQFPPESQAETAMVEQLARNDWFLQRAERRYGEIEERLGESHAGDWSEEQFRMLERILRYKTTAERSFQRSLTVVRQLRKDRQQEERVEEQAKRADTPRTVFEGRGKGRKPVFTVLEQWVEVRVTDGVTTTEYVPDNSELLKQGEESEAVPQMVYRRLNFPDGVPPEYSWTNLHEPERCEETRAGRWCALCSVKERGGCGTQRMTYQVWKEVIETEALQPGGHAGPTGCGICRDRRSAGARWRLRR